MRYNNIGGIMLSPLDMDDFTGMFCTGYIYPILTSIHKQLLSPLPKRTSVRKDKKRNHVLVDITRSPISSTTRTLTSLPTTNLIYDSIYDTTTELPITTTIDNSLKNQSRSKLQVPILEVKTVSETRPQDLTIGKANIKEKGSKKQTATIAYFDSLANVEKKMPNNKIEGTSKSWYIPQSSHSEQTDAILNQVETSTHMLIPQSTQAIQEGYNSQETDLRNFLKNAADLPSHSLINGIMKLLGNNGHSNLDKGKRKVTPLSDVKIVTSMKTTSFETTTEAIIRKHLNEPDTILPAMRVPAQIHANGQPPFDRGTGTRSKQVQPFTDTLRDKLSGKSIKEHLTIPSIRNDFNIRVNKPSSNKLGFHTFRKDVKHEAFKPRELVPPPFPLPDMKEARPSKSFLDMKDLGFLA